MPSTPAVTCTGRGFRMLWGRWTTLTPPRPDSATRPPTPRPRDTVDFPNPDGFDILAALADGNDEIGDIHDAARAAGREPGTISVWVTRRKIEPIVRGTDKAGDLYHLPTVRRAAARRPGRPRAA